MSLRPSQLEIFEENRGNITLDDNYLNENLHPFVFSYFHIEKAQLLYGGLLIYITAS